MGNFVTKTKKRVAKLQRSASGGSHRLTSSGRRSRMKRGKSLHGLGGGQHPRLVKNHQSSQGQKSSSHSTSRGSSRRSSSTAAGTAAGGPAGSRKLKNADADNSDNGDNPRLLKFLSEVFVATSIYLWKNPEMFENAAWTQKKKHLVVF